MRINFAYGGYREGSLMGSASQLTPKPPKDSKDSKDSKPKGLNKRSRPLTLSQPHQMPQWTWDREGASRLPAARHHGKKVSSSSSSFFLLLLPILLSFLVRPAGYSPDIHDFPGAKGKYSNMREISKVSDCSPLSSFLSFFFLSSFFLSCLLLTLPCCRVKTRGFPTPLTLS